MSGFRPFLVLLSVVFGLLFSGCKTLDEGPDTAITLQVTSDTELSRLTLIFRNLNGDEQRVDNPLGFDIRNEAFIFSIRPGERFQDDVFIWVQGFLGDELVAQASRVSRFEPGSVIEEMFELRAAFIDNDGDGFSPCSNGPSCDCDDTQATINPLAAEVCGDVIDNNCNGAAEEDCPCVEDQICTTVPETFIDVSAGVGQCQFGVRRCNDGVLGEQCEGALGIGDEEILGNFIDDDCDGSVDEGGDCSAGDSRPCFLGFIDDASHPDPTLQTGASDRALGECKLGVQECNPNGTWSSCQGEVRPQRDPETGVFKELTSQCDGLDNDCDGIIDDESYFDADSDGFTRCGTCRLGELPSGLCAESIDCNDADPLISPSAIELCGNDVDENCRCDHDDNDRPVGSDSAIAKPSLMLDGSRSCAAVNASLDCARLPRSDPNPTGICSELAQPYFAGFVEDDAGLLGACMSCGLSFGLQCLEGGGCSDPGYDCGACNVPDEVYAARPYCTRPDPMTCRNADEPVFLSIFDDDPYNDCGEIDCTGFYSGIVDGRCFRRADVAAETVLCEGTEQCETAQQLCPLAGAYSQPEPMPLCTFIDDGCSAEIAPTYQNQASGSDVFDECSDSYRCDTAEDGFGPYYDGIATQNGLTYCFFKSDVDNSACNGEGDCQTKAQACLASSQGATVPLRPQCELPVSGCQGISNPVYGVVERFQDPYNDCASELGCCVDASGEGACCRAQGSSCSVDTECGEGLSCVEGVCCDGSCDSPCESCLAELNTANEDGTCSPLASRQTDIAPILVCGDDVGGCGGDLGCECVAETGECRREVSALCDQGNECSTTLCECTDGNCTESRCAPEQCATCRFDSDQDGVCEGFIADGTDDFSGSCGAVGCNGLGSCNIEDGSACSVNQECLSNICRQGICGPPAGVGETCDENLDCLSPSRCELGELCGIPGIETNQVGIVSLAEGGSSVTIALGVSSQPSSDTILQLESSNSEFLISPLSLSFGPDDWVSPKLVTLTASNDVVDDGDISGTLSVFVSSSGDAGYQSVDSLTISVEVIDNDTAGFIVSPSSGILQLNEGDTESGSVALATQPTADVRVNVQTSDATEVLAPGSLTFTPSNWNTPQSFAVAAPTDSLVDGDQSVTLTLSVTSSSDAVYTNLDVAQLTVSVVDIDQAGLVLTNTGSLEVDESGGAAEFQVALSAEPGASVTVPLTLEPTGQAVLESSSLTFTSSNWDTPQTVRIVGLDDFIDDDTVAFYVDVGPTNSLDGQFVGYTRQVLVTALDDDQAGIVRGDPSQDSLDESGGVVSYLVTLNSQPTQSVDIPIASQNPSIAVSPSTLEFNNTNWSTGITVTATGIDDSVAQGDRSIGINWGPSTSSDTKYEGLTLLATSLIVVDDDSAGIEVGNTNLGVGETGSSVVAKFRLTSEPTQNVELSFSGGVGEVSFSPSNLTFTSGNWDTYQFVTVTGQDDDIDDGLQVETITVQAASLDSVYQGQSTTFVVQNADNDTAGVSVGVLGAPTITEAGGSTTFTLSLDTRPLNDVTVSFAVNSSRGSIVNGFQVFTPAQWNEERTVTIEAVDDSLDNGNATLTISATSSSLDDLYEDLSVAEQTITIIDDDDAGLVFGAVDGFTVTEGSAAEASTTVKLASQPTDDVTLSFGVDTSEVVMVSGALTFTALNWNQNQTVVFRSADDSVDDGVQNTVVSVSASSADSNYEALSQSLAVATNDDDAVGITISRSVAEVTEGGGTATVTVVLESEPTADVYIDITVSTGDLEASKSRLTFTASNWNSAQSLVVSAVDDAIYEGVESGSLMASPSASGDSLYANLSDQNFDFTIQDNETEPEVSIGDISVTEADSSVALSVSVSVSPVSNQAITIGYSTDEDTATAGSDYQSAAGNVVIPAGDASATIALTVLGDNLDENNEQFVLRLTSTSVGTFSLGGDEAVITITDDDAEPVISSVSVSPEQVSAALASSTTISCTFTDSDFTTASDYALTLAVRSPDGSTTSLCSSVTTSQTCGAGGSPLLTEPSPGTYRFDYAWDPAVSFGDGAYDVRCVIDDGANTDASGHGQNPDLVTLDSTSPTVVAVRESAGGDGNYEEDDSLLIEIEFTEAVTLSSGASLKLELDVSSTAGLQASDALYLSGSGTSVLTFIYDVEESSWADTSDLDYSSDSALELGSGATLVDAVGNSANLTLPAVGSVNSLSGTSDIQLN